VNSRQIYQLFINPRGRAPRWNPFNWRRMINRNFLFFRKFGVAIILLVFMTSIIIGFVTSTGSNLSVYDDYGIEGTTDRPSGFIWSALWWFRGQPAGFESNPDSWFTYNSFPVIPFASDVIGSWTTVHKTDLGVLAGENKGYNGPLLLWGFLTEWFVDATIYIPKFFDLGWLATNADVFLPFMFKFGLDFGILIVMLLGLIVLSPVIAVLISHLLPYAWSMLMSKAGPLLKVIVMFVIIGGLVAAFTGNLQWLQDLLAGM